MLVTALRRRRDDADMNVQTFKDPTVRVDARARKSREYDGQRLHLDAGAIDAGAFYASIAAIVGQPPADFKWTHIGHISREQRLRWRAEECRSLAGQFNEPECRLQMQLLAESYDNMAACVAVIDAGKHYLTVT